MKNFEVAESGNDEGLIKASKRAMIRTMRDVFAGLKKDFNQPGLTWEQLEYFLAEFEKKEPIIIRQEHEG